MSRQNSRFRVLAFAIAAVAGAALGLVLYQFAGIGPERSGVAGTSGKPKAVGQPLIGGPFELVDHTGKTRRPSDFKGKYMMVFFGYTHCPDFCPTGLSAMAEALDALGDDAAKIQPIFITVDPARDTPEVLNTYVSNFHKRLVGLSGSEAAIAKAAKAYRVYYAKSGDKSGDDYIMDHSTFTYLMGPDGKYLTHFSHGTDPKKVAARIRKLF